MRIMVKTHILIFSLQSLTEETQKSARAINTVMMGSFRYFQENLDRYLNKWYEIKLQMIEITLLDFSFLKQLLRKTTPGGNQ